MQALILVTFLSRKR